MADSPFKVALFLHSLAGGGAERVMVTLANAFADRGLKVDLVLAMSTGPFLHSVSPRVRVVDLNAPRFLLCLGPLVGYLRRERPNAVLSALNYVNVLAIVARYLAGVPVRLLVSEHNVIASGGLRSARGWLIVKLMQLTYPMADKVIAVSQGVAADLVLETRLSSRKIEVVYNPVVSEEVLRKAAEPLDHPWLAAEEPPVILGVGRLTEQKDFSTLVQAFAILRRQRPCRLVILGEGELRGEIEALAGRLGVGAELLLPGFVENPYAWMRHSAAFVLSSRWEGLPTVLIEAMACGTKVVSTDCPSGPGEILEYGRVGRLVPVADAPALVAAIKEALDHPSTKLTEQRASYFSLEQSVSRYLQLLTSTCLGSGPTTAAGR